MHLRISIPTAFLLLLGGVSAARAQQRIEFQRQKFDRSRFERPGEAAAPAASAPAQPAAPAAAEEFPPAAAPPPAADAAGAPAPFPADDGAAPRPPGGAAYPAGITPEEKAVYDAPLFDQIPSKTFGNAKDHDELVALQKKTGACMVVYFKNFAVPNEKGLCSWFEKTVTSDIQWRRAMRNYIQLTINVPGTSAVEELQTKYRANRTPAVFVVKPGSTMPVRIKLFDYGNGTRPVPVAAEEVVAAVKVASTPAYQTRF